MILEGIEAMNNGSLPPKVAIAILRGKALENMGMWIMLPLFVSSLISAKSGR